MDKNEFISLFYRKFLKTFENKNLKSNFGAFFMYGLFITEWKYAIETNQKLTDIVWLRNGYPCILDENQKTLFAKDCFKIANKYKNIYQINKNYTLVVVMDWVLNKIKNKNYCDISYLVFSTYPYITSNPQDKIDLLDSLVNYQKDYSFKPQGLKSLIKELK